MQAQPQHEEKETSGSAGSWHGRFFEGFRDMLFTAAADGRLIEVNQAGVRMFRYAGRNEMCRIVSMASLFRDAEGWNVLREKIEVLGFVRDVTMEMQRQDGSCFPACISANLRREPDRKIFCHGLLRDMTENGALQKSLTESEQRIRNLRHTLMILLHDVRGLLVSLAAGLDLLVRGKYGSVDERVDNVLKHLLSQTVRLNAIADDYLVRAAGIGEFGEIRRETLDLRKDVIDPVLEELADVILADHITIEKRVRAVSTGAVTVHAAGRLLRSVYRNLITNAIQYGGRGCVVFFGYEDYGRHHRLNVYNSGEPVLEEFRDKLFTKFGRVVNISENATAGTGLGLYLVREIIRQHGGDIWYEASQTGSNFVFIIPKEKEL